MDLEKILSDLKLFELDADLKKLRESTKNIFGKNTKKKNFYDGILERINNFEKYINDLWNKQRHFTNTNYLTHFSFFCFYFLLRNYLEIEKKNFESQNITDIENFFLIEYKTLIKKLKDLILRRQGELNALVETEKIKIQNNSNLSTIKLNSKSNMISKLEIMDILNEYINYSEQILKEVYKLLILFSQGANTNINIDNLPNKDYKNLKNKIKLKKEYTKKSNYTNINYLAKKRLMTEEEYNLFIKLITKLEQYLKQEELTFDQYVIYFSQLYNFLKKCNQIFITPKDFSEMKYSNNLKEYYSRNQEENIFEKIKKLMGDIAIKLLEKFSYEQIIQEIRKKENLKNTTSELAIIINSLASQNFRNPSKSLTSSTTKFSNDEKLQIKKQLSIQINAL